MKINDQESYDDREAKAITANTVALGYPSFWYNHVLPFLSEENKV